MYLELARAREQVLSLYAHVQYAVWDWVSRVSGSGSCATRSKVPHRATVRYLLFWYLDTEEPRRRTPRAGARAPPPAPPPPRPSEQRCSHASGENRSV